MARRRHRDTSAPQPDDRADKRGERDTPGADAFAVVRESHVPWSDDTPITREDEHYARINETAGDPLEPQDQALLEELEWR